MKKIMVGIITALSLQAFGSETLKGAQKDYEIFKKEMSEKVSIYEKEIVELRKKIKTKNEKAKDEAVKEYETALNKLRAEVSKIEESSKSNWDKVKGEISEHADSLNQKLQKALKD